MNLRTLWFHLFNVIVLLHLFVLSALAQGQGSFEKDFAGAAGNTNYVNNIYETVYLIGMGLSGGAGLMKLGQAAWRKGEGDPRWKDAVIPGCVLIGLIPCALFIKGIMTGQALTKVFSYAK